MPTTPNKAPTDYRFADQTTAPTYQTINEIREWLERFGARDFLDYLDTSRGFHVFGWQDPRGAFLAYMPLPDPKKFPTDKPPLAPKGRGSVHKSRYDQERARLLRVVFHLIKMKLIAVQEGVTTVDKEFFSDMVVWNEQGRQQTVYEWYAPQIEHLKKEGLQPQVFPAIAQPKLLPKYGE